MSDNVVINVNVNLSGKSGDFSGNASSKQAPASSSQDDDPNMAMLEVFDPQHYDRLMKYGY